MEDRNDNKTIRARLIKTRNFDFNIFSMFEDYEPFQLPDEKSLRALFSFVFRKFYSAKNSWNLKFQLTFN